MTNEQLKQIEVYFHTEISVSEFTSSMRRFMYASISNQLDKVNDDEGRSEPINEGFYYLTEFLEKIDPVLDK